MLLTIIDLFVALGFCLSRQQEFFLLQQIWSEGFFLLGFDRRRTKALRRRFIRRRRRDRSTPCTVGQNQVDMRHRTTHFITSSGVSEGARKWASELMDERSGARKRSKQAGASKWVSTGTCKKPRTYALIVGCSEPWCVDAGANADAGAEETVVEMLQSLITLVSVSYGLLRVFPFASSLKRQKR